MKNPEHRSKWALAYVLQVYRRAVSPAIRKQYRADVTDPKACEGAADDLEHLVRTLREAAAIARAECK